MITVSLDGYAAGPNQSVEEPLGSGGERLHEWMLPLKEFRELLGLGEGGETNASSAFLRESRENAGATIMGRNMFGGHPGPWDEKKPWTGWWGPNPPFRHPVFVVTSQPRAPLVMEGGTTFTFVTDGVERALELAVDAAGGRDVILAGGAQTARQYLAAGLVDEMRLSVAPALLHGGERLFFQNLGDAPRDLKHVRTTAGPKAVHYTFAR